SRTSVRTSSSTKAGCLPTGIWKFFKKGASRSFGRKCSFYERFYPCAKLHTLRAHLANSCKKVLEEWHHHFNYIIVNNLEDVPTNEPLYGMSNTISPLVKTKKTAKQPNITNWYDSTKIEPSNQLIINEAIVLAFIMC
ncbi:19328_t:CDS:1, partial [Gigaspora rosea]